MIKVEVKKSISVGDLDSWFGVCPKCQHALPPLETTAETYFTAGNVECVGCHARVDLWDAAKSQIDDNFPPEWGLQCLGAHQTFIDFEVRPGQIVTVDLTKHGIPRSAVLLYSSYQPADARAIPRLFELFSKQAADPAQQAVYCVPIQGAAMDPGWGRALICWIDRGAHAQPAARMANAFRDVAVKDLEGAVVEIFSAFEIALFILISRYIDRTCSSTTIRRMLVGRLSASQMMRVLPGVCEELKLAPPPKSVWEKLHELRRSRNDLLHKGTSEGLTPSVVGDFLAAALIGVAFIRHVEGSAA